MNDEDLIVRATALRAIFAVLVSLAITFAVAWFGALFPPGAWYASLAKPVWTPPNWVFAPVWTVLYIAMAVAAALVWCRTLRIGVALVLWLAQLVLNGLWSFLFFGFEAPGIAAIDIAALLVVIAATARAFWRISRRAAILLLPYALWAAYATALNLAIWRLNG